MKIAAIVLWAIALAACTDTRPPQERREDMLVACMQNGGNPVDCASAVEQTIPLPERKP